MAALMAFLFTVVVTATFLGSSSSDVFAEEEAFGLARRNFEFRAGVPAVVRSDQKPRNQIVLEPESIFVNVTRASCQWTPTKPPTPTAGEEPNEDTSASWTCVFFNDGFSSGSANDGKPLPEDRGEEDEAPLLKTAMAVRDGTTTLRSFYLPGEKYKVQCSGLRNSTDLATLAGSCHVRINVPNTIAFEIFRGVINMIIVIGMVFFLLFGPSSSPDSYGLGSTILTSIVISSLVDAFSGSPSS